LNAVLHFVSLIKFCLFDAVDALRDAPLRSESHEKAVTSSAADCPDGLSLINIMSGKEDVAMAKRHKQKQRTLASLYGAIGVIAIVMLRVMWLHPLHLPTSYFSQGHLAGLSSTHAFEGEVRTLDLVQMSSVQHSPELAAWKAAAHANLTAFKSTILEAAQNSGNRPFKRKMWSMFAPVVSCPPGRPLKRYPDAFEEEHHGDGQKLLCSLEHEETQTVGCVIYSMGSNGGLPVLC
jgi:hypothetical protein